MTPEQFANAPPPRSTGPVIRLLDVPVDACVEGLILSERSVGHEIHWEQPNLCAPRGRHVPCTRHLGACAFCDPPVCASRRWRAWLSVWANGHKQSSVIQLAWPAVLHDPRLSPDSQDSLRGLKFRARRNGKGPRAALLLDLGQTPVCKPAQCPPSIDLVQWCLVLWGLRDHGSGTSRAGLADNCPSRGGRPQHPDTSQDSEPHRMSAEDYRRVVDAYKEKGAQSA